MRYDAIKNIKGIVFNIQKYSVHDGPGIRTVVFLKGCPLTCRWCSNPESQSFAPQLAYNKNKCIATSGCRLCGEVCPGDAVVPGKADTIRIDWPKCTSCLSCAAVCPAGALVVYGEEKNVRDVVDLVEEDATFYARSGGGMTLGGGEPLVQPEFALALLREAKRRYIKTAIETCGYVSQQTLLEAAKYSNTLLYDIKSMDSETHKEFTGRGNERILENFRAVCREYPKLKVRVRTPVIPGFNDTEGDIRAIADFLGDYEVEHELLPYHRLGTQKYENMGKSYGLGDVSLENNCYLSLVAIAKRLEPFE